jgi:glycerate 2-kinase
VFVLSVGKAAPAMAGVAEECLGEGIEGGLVVTKEGHEAPLEILETIVASHPEPDERSVEAARRVIEFLELLGRETRLWPLFPVEPPRYSRTLPLPSSSRT